MTGRECFECKKPAIHYDEIVLKGDEKLYLGCCGTIQCCEKYKAPAKEQKWYDTYEGRMQRAREEIDHYVADGLYRAMGDTTRTDVFQIVRHAESSTQVWDYDAAKILIPYAIEKMKASGLEPETADNWLFQLAECICEVVRLPRFTEYKYNGACPYHRRPET